MLDLPELAVSQEPDAVERLAGLRALGVRVAVHDFGTAYASLRVLPRLPVDLLRVDGPRGPQDATVAEAVVRLSQALGLATLVGDVEVPADATDLRRLFAGTRRAMI